MPSIGQVPISPSVSAPIPLGAISVASLGALTVSQQESIVRGTIVVTATQSLVYTGYGDKTNATNYVELISQGYATDAELAVIRVATAWNSSHVEALGFKYQIGTMVYYAGHVYKCLAANDAIVPQVGGNAYWQDLGVGSLLDESHSGTTNVHGIADTSVVVDKLSKLNLSSTIDTSNPSWGGAPGGYINTSGLDEPGGNIDTRGNSSNNCYGGNIITKGGDGYDSPGGHIITQGGGGMTCGGGGINTSGSNDAAGGFIDTSAGDYAGGYIDTSGGGGVGGSIDTSGNDGANGGFISCRGQSGSNGGAINLSGGLNGSGGNITTAEGGGSIDTTGTGSIQLGVSGTRTTLNGSASGSNKTITLPNESGTLCLDSNKQKIFFNYNASTFSYTTATTADQWQATITIPGGILGTKGRLSVRLWAFCSASSSAKRLRAYVTSTNPGNAIGGTRICNYSSGSSTLALSAISLMRQFTIINRGSQSSQIVEPSASGGESATASADSFEETAINTANTWYLVIGLQKDSVADAYLLKQVYAEGVYAA